MIQKIGENIKRLRREHSMTQERLAEYLGVSTVAVSKWESSSTCPDISMLIPLSELFGVTTDELLGRVPGEREARLNAATAEVERAWHDGTYDEYVAAARHAVAEFPASEELRYHLFVALMRRTSVSSNPCANKRELMLEAEQIAITLLDETTNDDIRVRILPKLVYLYRNGFGDGEQAMSVAESIAPISHSREITKYYAISCEFGLDAIDALESACAHAIAFDDWNRCRRANESLCVRGLYYGEGEADKLGYSHCENMLSDKLADGFDDIRDTDRFRAILASLNDHLNK